MTDAIESSQTAHNLYSMTQDELVAKFEVSSQEETSEVIQLICEEIKNSVNKSNIDSLKKLLYFYVKIRNLLLNSSNGFQKWMKIPNIIILACKLNKLDVLDFIFSDEEILKLLLFHNEFNIVSPYDEDNMKHNAFYYAIRSNNVSLLKTLIKKWPAEKWNVNRKWIPEELDALLARAFKELKLRNIHIEDKMEFFVVENLVDLRFLSSRSKTKETTIKDVKERIELVCETIRSLLEEYQQENVDDVFLFKVKFVAQNIFILKGQLKSTYNRIPWEEMYFFAVSFISTVTDGQNSKIFSVYLTKSVLLTHLNNFASCLKIESECFNENAKLNDFLSWPREFKDKILSREKATEVITNTYSYFRDLYTHYTQIRDLYSLEIIHNALEISLLDHIKNKEQLLIIKRSLQITGEHLKYTLESPKLSHSKVNMIINNVSNWAKHILIDLRDSLTHGKKQSISFLMEQINDQQLFDLLNDLKKLKTIVNGMLLAQKTEIIDDIYFKCFDDGVSLEIEEILKHVFSINFNDIFSKNFAFDEMFEVQNILKQLSIVVQNTEVYKKSSYGKLIETLDSENYNMNHGKLTYLLSIERLKIFDVKCYQSFKKIGLWTIQYAMPELKIFPQPIDLLLEILHEARTLTDVDTVNNLQRLINILNLQIPRLNFMQGLRDQIKNFNGSFHEQASKSYSFCEDSSLNKNVLKHDLAAYKSDIRLKFFLEIELLDKLNEIKDRKLIHNTNFLDNDCPTLLGRNLRNNLAHENVLDNILLNQTSFIVLLNTLKLDTLKDFNNLCFDKKIDYNIRHVNDRYKRDLKIVVNQKKMFDTIKQGNLSILKTCIEDGADLNARHITCGNALHFAAKSNLCTMKYILKYIWYSYINEKDSNYKTPLHIAAENGNLNIVQYLLMQPNVEIDSTDIHRKTPLHLAAQKGHKNEVECLINHHANLKIRDLHECVAAHYAAMNDETDIFEKLFDNDDFSAKRTVIPLPIITPYMHTASFKGSLNIINFLLSKNADVNEADYYGYTPLHAAAISGKVEVVRFLVTKGADIDSKSICDITPLHHAVLSGNEETVLLILSAKAEVNAPDVFGFTALHYACKEGFLDIALNLITYGASVHSKDNLGLTPLMMAVENGHSYITDSLLRKGARINDQSRRKLTPLHLSNKSNKKEIIELLLDNGADLYSKDMLGFTPLHWASLKNERIFIDTLFSVNTKICVGVDIIDVRDYSNFTPLLLAAMLENWTVVDALIEFGANIHLKIKEPIENEKHTNSLNCEKWIRYEIYEPSIDIHDWELIHFCARSGKDKMIENLIAKGFNINAQGSDGNTPLHLASYFNKLGAVKVLVTNECDIDVENSTKYTPLCCAICKNNTEIVNLLISKGANVNANSLPLKLAIHFGYRNIVFKLINNPKININLLVSTQAYNILCSNMISDRQSFLHFSAQSYDTEVIEKLLNLGIDVNIKTSVYKLTALHIASQFDITEVIKLLLQKGANIDARAEGNITPLHSAVYANNIKSAKLLLEKGAKSDIKNCEKLTPIDIAVKNNQLEILKIINKFCKTTCTVQSSLKCILFAVFCGNRDIVEYLISSSIIKNIKMFKKELLNAAVQGSSPEVITYLISLNFSVDSFGEDQWKPNTVFAKEDVLKIFIDHGTCYEYEKFSKFSGIVKEKLILTKTLHGAVEINNVNAANDCMKRGAFVNAKNKENEVPLHIAIRKGHFEIVLLLLQHGANPNIIGKLGSSLHYAATFKHFEIAKLLLGHGVIYNSNFNGNYTPRMVSKHSGITELLDKIDKLFKDVTMLKSGVTDELENISDFDEFKAVINSRNKNFKTLITTAAQHDFPKLSSLKKIGQKILHILREKANSFLNEGKYDKSLQILEDILVRSCEISGNDNEFSLDIQLDIGEVMIKKYNFDAAKKYFQLVHEKRKINLGKNHEETLHAAALIAITMHYQENYAKAVDELKVIYSQQQQNLKRSHEKMLLYQKYILFGLAKMGRLNELENVSKLFLQHYNGKSSFGDSIVASIYKLRKEYKKAEELYEHIFQIEKCSLGLKHLQTLKTNRKIANLLVDQAKYRDALLIYEDILKIQIDSFGWKHIETLLTMFQMAKLFFFIEAYFEAYGFYHVILTKTSFIQENNYFTKAIEESILKIQIKFTSFWGPQGIESCKILSFKATNKLLATFSKKDNSELLKNLEKSIMEKKSILNNSQHSFSLERITMPVFEQNQLYWKTCNC